MSFDKLHISNQLPEELGPQLSANSLSITFASDATGIPVSLTNDTNYGVVGANTLRTAAQIGNATGAAAFGTGLRSAQVLRVTIATDDVLPVSQSGVFNITNISGTVSLPTGASTAALQTTGNSSLSSIDGKLNSLGQKAMAGSAPVVIASDQSTLGVLATNFPTTVSTGTGASSASTLRVILASDQATLAVSVQNSTLAVTQSGTWAVGVTNLPTTADVNFGAPGVSTLRSAAMLGVGSTAVSNANPVPVSDAGGSITVDGTVAVSNFPATVDTNSGAAGASTLRSVLATRHEAVATPLSVRLSDGTDFITSQALAASQLTTATATKTLITSGPVQGWDGSTHREISVDTSGFINVNAGTAIANIAYQAKGKIAGTALTGSYATVLNPTSDLRIIYLLNSCNQSIFVSLDGGTTDTFELDPGESTSIDLATNGRKFDNTINISAKHNGVVPTTGSIRVTGLG